MDRDTDIFVQAFWVKCRETIRPELDQMVGELNSSGHQAHVSTQEYSAVADGLPDPGPSLILTVHPNGWPDVSTLKFSGNVARKEVEVAASNDKPRRYELADLDVTVAKREINGWATELLSLRP
jgi:hypothetical protein